MRRSVDEDLKLQGLSQRKILAIVVRLMERTSARIGNMAYWKLYGSYGLTTLRDKHIKIAVKILSWNFIGKKGIKHSIQFKSARLARLIKKCREIPGQDLFQYYDENGDRKPIDSGMVNTYIKEISGEYLQLKISEHGKAPCWQFRPCSILDPQLLRAKRKKIL
jgi:DNA topoisomerase-1